MYQPGDIQVEIKPYEAYNNDSDDYDDWYHGPRGDARENDAHPREPYWPVAYLPHSCDQWIIGGVEQIDAMIADLQSARIQLTTKEVL